jgi:hypothetical protein
MQQSLWDLLPEEKEDKVTMAMAMSHGEKVDWDKVSSSMVKDNDGKDVSIKAFLEVAKKYLLQDDGPHLAR